MPSPIGSDWVCGSPDDSLFTSTPTLATLGGMMMEWSSAYAVGEPSLDNHHQELFLLTSRLDAAIQTGNPQHLDDIIVFLEEYVVSHFHEEESVMHHHQYTGYDMHRSEHDVLKFKVQELRKWFQGNVPKAHLIFGIRRTVDALMTHIRLVDVGIADIIKEDKGHP